MKVSQAWRVQFSDGKSALIGSRQLLHLLPPTVELHEVPGSPPYCRHALVWEGEPIPVIDVSAWLIGRPSKAMPAAYGVAAFRGGAQSEAQRGALAFASVPRRIEVTDEEICAPPPEWQAVSLSCVSHDNELLPVLNLTHMFSGALHDDADAQGPG